VPPSARLLGRSGGCETGAREHDFVMSGLSAVLLGTGNPLPDPNRAGASTLIRAGSKLLLVDAGRGVCMRLAAAGTLPLMLNGVLLTHLHSDHICDLNDVVTTHWIMSREPTPLRIYGPKGTGAVVDGIRAMLAADISYRLAHHADLNWEPVIEVVEIGAGPVMDEDGVRVTASGSDHRPVEPSLAYRFDHDDKAIVVAGDTIPCPGLDAICDGADVYIQTVLRPDLVRLVQMQRFVDTVDYHSSVEQAAETAARCGVGTLVLTHQIPTPAPGSEDEWVSLARAHFSGNVIFANDLTEV
jgi:ribonuclease Z